jgi:hypothetical protein
MRRWPLVPTLAAATPALAFGHAIGRIGCLLVGDDYGRQTNLPGVSHFPRGCRRRWCPSIPRRFTKAVCSGSACCQHGRWLNLRMMAARRMRLIGVLTVVVAAGLGLFAASLHA